MRKTTGALVLFIVAVVIFEIADYDYHRDRPVEVEVIGKVIRGGGRHQDTFHLIVKNTQWGVFDVIASPADYVMTREGDRTTFSLSEKDIRPDCRSVLHAFGPVGVLLALLWWRYEYVFRERKE